MLAHFESSGKQAWVSPAHDHWPPQSGTLLGGKYRLVRVLGQGGMGIVWHATHEGLDEAVAIKILLDEGTEQRARFTREARTASKLKSPHAVRIRDVSESFEHPFIVMEYLEGENLAVWLKRESLRPVPFVVDTIIEACEALAEAHRVGIIHRDIKPENLFLSATHIGEPIAKLLDFGISKPQADTSITTTSGVLGTPLYMSPEQLKGSRALDERTDIWSMGATLHALLCGTPPFTGDSSAEIAAMIIRDSATRASSLREDVPEDLENIILKALSKSPASRFQSITEFAFALEPFCSDRGTRALSLMRRSEQLGASKGVHRGEETPQSFETDPTLRAEGTPKTTPLETPLDATRTASAWGGVDALEKKRVGPWAIAATLLLALATTFAISKASRSAGSSKPVEQVATLPLPTGEISAEKVPLPASATAAPQPALTQETPPSTRSLPASSGSAVSPSSSTPIRKKAAPRPVWAAPQPSTDVYEQRN